MIENLKRNISLSALDASGSLNKYYYNTVPQGTVYPYAVYFLINETYNGKDSNVLYGDIKLQFNIYSNYRDYGNQCNDILQEILDYFDNDYLSFANTNGLNMVSVIRDFTRPSFSPDNGETWQATAQYNIHIAN